MIKAFSRTVLGLFLAVAATAVFAAGGTDKVQVADNAPDSYVVKKGDTLWAISGMFLKQPWRWPEVWKMNQEQIHNPHLIYPGQVVVLDRNGPSLSIGRSVSGGLEKLSPQVYSKDAGSPIASVSLDAIRAFLTEPLVSETDDSPNLPTVVAIQEERVLAGGLGDTIYAKNLLPGVESWHVYRRGKALVNPTNPKDVLGFEAQYVATAQVTIGASGDKAAELRVTKSKHEVVSSDRLQPEGKSELLAIPPHSPTNEVTGAVVSIQDGVATAGRNSVIAVSAGRDKGIEPGHVLALIRNNGSAIYRGDDKAETINLPDSRVGLLYVFRVFNRVAYGLIVEASGPLKVGDKVTNP